MGAEHGKLRVLSEILRRKKEAMHDDDEDANSPLHLAAMNGKTSCMKELIKMGATVTSKNAKEQTPLACCALNGMRESAVVLLEAGAPVDPRDRNNLTPLHISCQLGYDEMVSTLLK